MPGLVANEAVEQELFDKTDFADRDQIIQLMPGYIREQWALKKANVKNVSKQVNIEGFTMKTPFGDQVLLNNTELLLEPNKRQCLYGVNCSGKTLLFTNISEGKIKEFPKHIHVHHCRELEGHELHETVINTVVNSHPYRQALLKVQAKLQSLLAAEPAPEGDLRTSLKDNLSYIDFQLTTIRSEDAVDRAQKMLRVLGFDEFGCNKFGHCFIWWSPYACRPRYGLLHRSRLIIIG
jgi:hypothetical protein